MHVDDAVLDAEGRIDPNKIDLVARMGGDYYCRASGSAVFTVPKPNVSIGIGVPQCALTMRYQHSAQPKFPAFYQFMKIDTLPYSIHLDFSLRL